MHSTFSFFGCNDKDGYNVPHKENHDFISYVDDIKPFIEGTPFHLARVETDWPGGKPRTFTQR